MGVMKSCLAIIGIGALLLIGSCVAGVGILKMAVAGVLDPQNASQRIEKPEAEVKQAVYEYLDGVKSGSFAERAKVEYMSDGSMQMHIGKGEPYDMTMKVTFEPAGPTATKVSATYNADRLAWAQPIKTMSTNLHRCIHDDFEHFAKDLHNGNGGNSLDLDDLIVRSRAGNRELRCDLSGSAGKTADDDEISVTRAKRDNDYTPPAPADGEPDERAGKPTVNTYTD
jgi:hypothetical protein